MSIVFRLLGHTGIFVSYVYIFCFASSLLESSWWNWPWFLLTGGFLLGCYAGIVPDDWNPDDVDYNDQLVAVSIIEPICLTSILIKLFVHASSYSGILLPLAVLYILAIGVNRVAFSQLFGLIGIFTVWPYVNFHIWYELIGFIIFCILSVGLMVSSLIYHFNQEDDEDEDTLIGTSIANFVLVSLLLASGLLFINYRNPIVEQLPTMGYLYFVFCLLGLLVAFTNNVAAIISAIASSVFFFTFVLDWGTSVDWGLAGLSSTWQWLSLFFSTLWSWIVWCATHLWDGIVWCVVGLWKCIVWPFTHFWNWLTSISFNLSWNWDLFTLTWCSVIMWGGIILGVFITIMLLVWLFVENGLHALKYIAHIITSILLIYEFAFANVPEDAQWWYWFFFSLGIFFVLVDFVLIYGITRGNINNGTVGFQFAISLLLSLCLCYKLYVNSEPAYLLIISIVACVMCLSFTTIIQGAVSSASHLTKIKPAMEYHGTSMTCPYCRENYVKQWVVGTQIKGTSRTVVKTGIKAGAQVGGLTMGAAAGAKAGAAIGMVGGPAGAALGALLGGALAAVGTWAVNKQIDDAVDYGYDQANSEYGDGNDWKFKCPECGNVWYKKEKYGEIVH